ncbi:septum formation family protein [Longispora urticae]
MGYSRGSFLGAALAVASLTLSGCALLPGGAEKKDPLAAGDKVGECWNSTSAPAQNGFPQSTLGRKLVDCSASHEFETFFVGETDGTAGRDTMLTTGYDRCEREAEAYLGAHRQTGRLEVEMYTEDKTANGTMKRWLTCVLAESRSYLVRTFVPRTGLLKGVLAQPGPLLFGCVEPRYEGSNVQDVDYLPNCDGPHGGEFAGLAKLDPGALPTSATELQTAAVSACEKTAMEYLGWPSTKTSKDVTVLWLGPQMDGVKHGLLTLRCLVVPTGGRHFTGLVQGIGEQALPLA